MVVKRSFPNMCKCFCAILRLLACVINVVAFFAGLALIGAGSYAYAKVDFDDIIGHAYQKHVPPIQNFLPTYSKNNPTTVDSMQDKVDDYMTTRLEEFAEVCRDMTIAFIVLGCFLAFFGLIGMMALSCCSRLVIVLFIFLILLVLTFIPMLILCILSFQTSFLQGLLFKQMDKVALSSSIESRFFMAALQGSLQCCGVRGANDYFCSGVYDYACNPGCFSLNEIWQQMHSSAYPPVCVMTEKLKNKCHELFPYPMNKCNGINVQKPINASTAAMCKDYADIYDTSGQPSKNLDFGSFDPAKTNENIYGSPFYIRNDIDRYQANIPNKLGCGYKLWSNPDIDMETKTTIINIMMVIIVLILALEIVLVLIFWRHGKKDDKRRSDEYSRDTRTV